MTRATQPEARAGQRPDAGTRELLFLPLLMGGLSLLMWFSMPTSRDVRDHYAADIEHREAWVRRAVAALPGNGRAPVTGCAHPLDPLPVRQPGDPFATNTEIVAPSDLDKLGIPGPLRGDTHFYLRGTLSLLMYWRHFPPYNSGRRMGGDRIQEQVVQPLATRYLILYGVETLTDAGSSRVDAFVFELASSRLLCTLRGRYRGGSSGSAEFLADLATLTGGQFPE